MSDEIKETAAATQAAAEAEAPAAEAAAVDNKRKKTGRYIPNGIAFIHATFNNTKVAFTDLHGNVIAWSSSGKNGFKGSRKSTAYAGTVVTQEACKVALGHGLHEVEILVQGPGSGRESAIRAVQAAGLTITGIRDITPVPHNGCRARKRRRV